MDVGVVLFLFMGNGFSMMGLPSGVLFRVPEHAKSLAFSLVAAGVAVLSAGTVPAHAAEPGMLVAVSAPVSNGYSVSFPKSSGPQVEAARLGSRASLKGWDHLFELLVDEGAEPAMLARIFSDTRMPERETLYFSLTPREARSLYRKHNSRAAQNNALRFYREHESTFVKAESRYGVPRSMILSLLQIETSCGAVTGNDRVFPRLARLAAASAPDNIEANYAQKKRAMKLLTIDRVKDRASVLQDLFLSHTAATIAVAKELGVHPLELRGSSAGAIGLPQFLPGNVERFGADGDGDGNVNVFHEADAILSVARFLSENGWNAKHALSSREKREVLYHYNRSEPYVTTALALARSLDASISKNSSRKGK